MKTVTVLSALVLGLTATAMPARAGEDKQPTKPRAAAPAPAQPSASPQTGGDTTPSAVDPAQADKTGANAGEGASYNRSTEKGESTLPKDGREGDKKQ
jgi:hypothetical protein